MCDYIDRPRVLTSYPAQLAVPELEQWKSSLTKEEVDRQNAYNRYQRNLGRKKLRYSPLRDPRRPKKPMSGFFLYLSEGRAKGEHKQEGQKMRDWIAKQGANWKALSEEEQRVSRILRNRHDHSMVPRDDLICAPTALTLVKNFLTHLTTLPALRRSSEVDI